MTRLRLAVVGLLLSLSGCSFDAKVPDTALVSCPDAGRCPTGFHCVAELSVCIADSQQDRSAPGIKSSSLSHHALRRGVQLVVKVTPDEPLGTAPEVKLGERALTAQTTSLQAESVFVFTPDPDARHGEVAAVTATLQDVFGNRTAPQVLGTVRFDFEPPRLLGSVPSPEDGGTQVFRDVRSDVVLQVEATLDEPVLGAVEVRATATDCDAGTRTLRSVTSGSSIFVAEGALANTSGCTMAFGLDNATDEAGNVAEHIALPLVARVDDEPPHVDGGTEVQRLDGGWVPATTFSGKPGFSLASVAFTAEGAATVSVRVDDRPVPCALDACLAQGTLCRCSWQVDERADAEGLRFVTIQAADRAGNGQLVQSIVRYDFSAPALQPGAAVAIEAVGSTQRPPTQLSAHSRGTLSFSVSERLGTAPRLALTPNGASTLATATSELSYTASLAYDGGVGGRQDVWVSLVDEVGNARDAGLAALFGIDVVTPTPPVTAPDAGVVLTRLPWGNVTQSPGLIVTGPAASVEPGSVVRVLSSGVELGRTFAQADGSFRLSLSVVDRPTVEVSVVDEGANESAPVAVRDIEWVATFNGKERTPALPNPHVFEARSDFRGQLVEPGLRAFTNYQPLVSTSGLVTTRSSGRWEEQTFNPAPGIGGGGVAFDTLRGRLVAFGGGSGQGVSSDTWEWNGTTWRRAATTGPRGRTSFQMVFDEHRARVVLFGGTRNSQDVDDTWEWDGFAWLERTPAHVPPARHDARLTYDSNLQRVLLFGGDTIGIGSQSDLWSWDGEDWQLLPQPGAAPAARSQHNLVFDRARNVAVLFGGGRIVSNRRTVWNDVWEYGNGRWTDRTPADGGIGRALGGAAYMPGLGVVVYGGEDDTGYPSSMFAWDGARWTPLATANDPGGTNGVMLEYDPGNNALLAGHVAGNISLSWSNGVWSRKPIATLTPGSALGPALAVDPVLNAPMAYGGTNTNALPYQFSWSGTEWTRYAVTTPPGRASHFMATAGRDVIVNGGYHVPEESETIVWRDGGWLQLPDGGAPAANALAGDGVGSALLLGNRFGRDVWLYADAGWRQLDAGMTPLFTSRSLGFHAGLGQWVYVQDGRSWAVDRNGGFRDLSISTPPIENACLAYDSTRDRLVHFGGYAGLTTTNDTYEFDGRAWVDTSPLGLRPPARSPCALAYDARNRNALMIGGNAFEADAWTYSFDSTGRPAHVAKFDVSTLQLEPGAVVKSATLGWVGGAGAGADAGVSVQVFRRGYFQAPSSGGGTAASPSMVTWSTQDPVALDALITRASTFTGALVPAMSNGSSASVVSSGPVELRVSYRRP